MRKVAYITGTRADFGLMRRTLQTIRDAPDLDLTVLVTGAHLSADYGDTLGEITAAGLRVTCKAPVPLEPTTGGTTARNIGAMLAAFVGAFEADRPDVVLLLGDRGEMLAGALAAIHLNIAVAHVHGGERSGSVDEPVRHAISKLSHLHFTATDGARRRLIRMGERPEAIHVTGAPGLDGLTGPPRPSREQVMTAHGLDPERPFALMIYHPVLQEATKAAGQAAMLLAELLAAGCQVLALAPNADAGGAGVRGALDEVAGAPGLALCTHLPREEFLAAMAAADLMAGNSSAGIIEAASFGTPVLNLGSRQTLRERNRNVVDVAATAPAVRRAIRRLLDHGRFSAENIYGDGRAAERIAALLASVPLDAALLGKVNRY